MRYQFLSAALLLIVCSRPCGFAQPSGQGTPSPDPPPQPALGSEGRCSPKFLEGVSEETRERFRAARERALQDPKVQQLRLNAEKAKREFFKAMRDKMLEIDPGLAEIVRKRSAERKVWKLWRGSGGLRALSEEERRKLLSAMEKVNSDPAVEAAKKKKWEASSTDERKAAEENYRNVLREAMAKSDPTILPILDKLGSGKDSVSDPLDDSPEEEK